MKINSVTPVLVIAMGFTISLLIFRIYYSASLMYLFFVWNLFLAALPLKINVHLSKAKNKIIQWMLFALWLLFFPNSLYVFTDFVHLKERYPVPLWFDAILVFSAAMNGLVLAYLSLHQIEIFLKSKFSHNKSTLIVYASLFLSSFGIYLGRFLRMNSWDIISNPAGIIFQVFDRVVNPFEHPRTWGMTIVFTGFFSIFYYTMKTLPNLIIKKSIYESKMV